MNNAEREQWIDNDEGLYDWYQSWERCNPGGKRGFIKANRAEIDFCIGKVLNGNNRAHYLKYGG